MSRTHCQRRRQRRLWRGSVAARTRRDARRSGGVEGAADPAELQGFEERVNNLLSEHNARLLHTGQHTGRSFEGDLFQHVVAVLGVSSEGEILSPSEAAEHGFG
jgi:hypothetical protein